MVNGIDNIGIGVSDWKRALQFYQVKLGFNIPHSNEQGGSFTVDTGPNSPTLYIYETAKKSSRPVDRGADPLANDVGIDHISFGVDDVDAVYESLSARGVDFLTTPTTIEPIKLRVARILDPDGNRLSFIKRL